MSFFRYPGGKKKLRNEIKARLIDLAEHAKEPIQYREPFFGGGSIGLLFLSQSATTKSIWINDKDIALCCLWTSIIKYVDEFIKLVEQFEPSVEQFYTIKDELLALNEMPKTEKEIIDLALKKLAIHQISFSGLGVKSGGPLGGKKQESKYGINCRWSPKYIAKKAKTLSKQFASIDIHEGKCTNLDFSEVIEENSARSLIYLDPPYYVKGNELYQFGFTYDDHKRLMSCLKSTQHLWLLSYDDCPEIRELYSWAHIEELDVQYSIAGSTKKGELLISNIKK